MSRKRVLLCSVDGMRPDALAAAHTPTFDRLIRGGAYTPRARTVMPSVTLPCHTSMLRGVDVTRHGINTNTFHPLVRHVPSLIDVAKDGGKRTGFFYNWEELRDLAAPGKLDTSGMHVDTDSAEGDRRVAHLACDALRNHDLDLLFVYFGWTDAAGHKYGWMSDEQIEAISNADACLGQVLATVEELDRAGETVVQVLSDHGGHERSHGTEMDEDMLIPWLIHDPGVRAGHAIEGPVRIYDTCVTLAHVLGLKPDPAWDGRVVTEALID